MNSVVLVSGLQQSDSVMHTCVSNLFQVLLPFKLLPNIEQSFPCYTAHPCWPSVLNIGVCACQFQIP